MRNYATPAFVMISGMRVQKDDIRETLLRARAFGRRTMIGGPFASSEPDLLVLPLLVLLRGLRSVLASLYDASRFYDPCYRSLLHWAGSTRPFEISDDAWFRAALPATSL